MKRSFCKILSLLCVCVLLLLNSACSRTYQRCYYHAFSTDGVYSAEDTVYRANGKYYVQGQRAQLRRERYRSCPLRPRIFSKPWAVLTGNWVPPFSSVSTAWKT